MIPRIMRGVLHSVNQFKTQIMGWAYTDLDVSSSVPPSFLDYCGGTASDFLANTVHSIDKKKLQ